MQKFYVVVEVGFWAGESSIDTTLCKTKKEAQENMNSRIQSARIDLQDCKDFKEEIEKNYYYCYMNYRFMEGHTIITIKEIGA